MFQMWKKWTLKDEKSITNRVEYQSSSQTSASSSDMETSEGSSSDSEEEDSEKVSPGSKFLPPCGQNEKTKQYQTSV